MTTRKTKGQSTKPEERRLTKRELRKELMSQAREKPHILSAEEYEEWLKHTVLSRLERGENALDEVRKALKKAARGGDQEDAKDLHLAVEALERATIAFQYAPLKFNIMWMPAVGGRPVMNPILWEPTPKAK